MKKSTLRIISVILSALLALPCFACAKASENGNADGTAGDTSANVSEAETLSPDATLDVPDKNFGGYTFRVMSANYDAFFTQLDVEKLTSEVVSDAIFNRNREIESKYGVVFECDTDDYTNLPSVLERQVKSGSDDSTAYDLIMLIARNAYTATLKKYLTPYDNLEYVDTNKEYYYRDINKQFTIGGKTFFAFSAESVNVLSFANCIIFNKQIAEDHGIPDVYELVNDKEWTYEKLFQYAELCTSNADGNGAITYGEDVIGLIGDYDRANPSAWIAAGCKLVNKDADDLPSYTADTDERLIEVLQYVLPHFGMEYCRTFTAGDEKAKSFKDNKAFMLSTQVGELIAIRDMSTDYGVVPWPMYNAQQDRYYPRAEDGWLHCVPNTCSDTERTSIILQALAYYSYQTVYEAYYEQALSAKYIRDGQSVDMLKLILSSLTLDIGDTVWYEKIRSQIVNDFNSKKGNTNVVSTLKKYTKTARKLVKEATDFASDI